MRSVRWSMTVLVLAMAMMVATITPAQAQRCYERTATAVAKNRHGWETIRFSQTVEWCARFSKVRGWKIIDIEFSSPKVWIASWTNWQYKGDPYHHSYDWGQVGESLMGHHQEALFEACWVILCKRQFGEIDIEVAAWPNDNFHATATIAPLKG